MVQPRTPGQIQVKCPNCGQPFLASLEQAVDGGRDPQAKARLLAGRLNVANCPACGVTFQMATPLLYHDARKELLIIYVPMELGLPRNEQERVIGSLTQAIVQSLPQEERRGYLLMPKTALTMQGMAEMILEKDGITREMLEARRAKLNLVEQFLQAGPENLDALAAEHDAGIDDEFFALLTASADAALANGVREVAEQILALRQALLEKTAAGKRLMQEAADEETAVNEIGAALDALGEHITREALLDLMVEFAQRESGDTYVTLLVGMIRPMLDYDFFMLLAQRIEAAGEAEREFLEALREQVSTLARAIDAQGESMAQQALQALQNIFRAEDLDEAIRQHLDVIDDTFLAMLSANMQNAGRTGNTEAAARFQEISERVMAVLQESAPPALRLINELMQIPDFNQARQTLEARASEFGPDLVELFDVLIAQLSAQGSTPTLERLQRLRGVADAALNGPAPAPKALDGDGRGSGIVLPFSARSKRKGQ